MICPVCRGEFSPYPQAAWIERGGQRVCDMCERNILVEASSQIAAKAYAAHLYSRSHAIGGQA